MASSSTSIFVNEDSEGDDDRDDISLTSTIYGEGENEEPEPDKDWIVDDILAERPHSEIQGTTEYLIKWEGYPLNECTWEPLENLGAGLLGQWEESKREIEAGKRLPFELDRYTAACADQAERHRRRNNKRRRLGLPLTAPFPPDDGAEEVTFATLTARKDSPSSDSEEEAQETDIVDPDASAARDKTTRPIKQKIFRGLLSDQLLTKQRPPTDSRQPSDPPRTTKLLSHKQKLDTSSTKRLNTPQSQTLGGASMGYQGTARKPSVGTSDRTPKTGETATGYQGTAKKPSISASIMGAPSATKPPTPKVSGHTFKSSSSGPPSLVRSSSPVNKRGGKRLTAHRTQPLSKRTAVSRPTAVGNIFIDGAKARKKRVNLGDALADPTRTPKPFKNMHTQYLATKIVHARNDAAAPFSSIPSRLLITNDKPNDLSKDHGRSPRSPQNLSEGDQPDPKTASPVSVPVSPSKSLISALSEDQSGPGPVPKRKKSVRFMQMEDCETMADEIDALFDEPMDMDYALPVTDSPRSAVHVAPDTSLGVSEERNQTQDVVKLATFGPAGSDEARVTFSGITRCTDAWFSTFFAVDKLHFGRVCTASNFISQQKQVKEDLSAGFMEAASGDHATVLRNVSQRLRRMSSGLHLATAEYSVLVYPTKCEGWAGLNSDIGTANSVITLRYLIYKPPHDPRLYPTSSHLPIDLEKAVVGSHCRALTKTMIHLDFDKILPQELKLRDSQVYFLLFPSETEQLSRMMKLCLREGQPGCRIFSHEIRESWLKFHEAVRAGAAGTVIVHSDMTSTIRQIPLLWRMLDSKSCYTFWNLSAGEYDPPLYPSYPSVDNAPGTLRMTRLFPFGRVYMITPSFVLSEPELLFKFLEWFKRYACNPHYLIMACADFPKYLQDITLEKLSEHRAMLAEYKDDPRLEDRLIASGRRWQDVQNTYKAWQSLIEIIQQYGDEETSEESRKVSWITSLINPNDEQSLVNYFCWWSTRNLDRYRKFCVLGSQGSNITQAYRNIQIPLYTDDSTSDPDIATAMSDQYESARAALDSQLEWDRLRAGSLVAKSSASFPSAMFSDDSPAELQKWIASVNSSFNVCWTKIHDKPVSWVDGSMADRFGDGRCAWDTYRNWFFSAPAFSKIANTWFGLFYTIDKAWISGRPLRVYGRHPWVAIYRPVNPHFNDEAYKEMELLIWDPSFDRFMAEQGDPGVLLDMQRRLVNFVREQTPIKSPGCYLKRVWVAKLTKAQFEAGGNILDATCRQIWSIYTDPRTLLPPYEKKLLSVGWMALKLPDWKIDPISTATFGRHAREASSILRNEGDIGRPERGIWHPPRRRIKTGASRCLNALFEATRRARLADPTCQTMIYRYTSTLDWYSEQEKEGRDTSHVRIDITEPMLRQLWDKLG